MLIKKKKLCLVFALVLLLTGMSVPLGGETIEAERNVVEKIEPQDPQMIYDWHDLNKTRNNLDGNYTLRNDLTEEASGYDELVDTEDGWEPIGGNDNRFRGAFDGNGHEIRSLFINRSGKEEIGLFGSLDERGNIHSVSIVNADTTGGKVIGTLVGNNDGAVSNSSATGRVSGSGDVGGLVGRNGGTVSNSSSTAEVYAERTSGGLIGSNFGAVNYSYASGDLSGGMTGGLVGYNGGLVSNSYAIGDISQGGWIGGLIGNNGHDGRIKNSYATGNVTGVGRRGGGLIGENDGGSVEKSYASGDVNGSERIGGLIGLSSGVVSNTYASGNVKGDANIGGLVGENTGMLEKSYARGKIDGIENTGGLVGEDRDGTVKNSFWDIDTSEQNSSDGGEGKISAEMKHIATYTDTDAEGLEEPWDFVGDPYDDEGDQDIWDMDDWFGGNYPFLGWEKEYELTIKEPIGEGTVNINGEEVTEWPYQERFEEDTGIDLKAVPREGWSFQSWIGDHEDTEEKIEVIMDEDKTITVKFEIKTYGLDVERVGEGMVEVEPEKKEYEHGEGVELRAVPEEGWLFEKWTGDHEGTDEQINITMDDDKEITAVFEEIPKYELTVNIDGEGDVEMEPDREEYKQGTEVRLAAIPEEGWLFREWKGGYEGTDEQINITMDRDMHITAIFEEKIEYYELEIEIEGEGSTEPEEGSHTYDHGEEVTVEPVPEDGWVFSHWSGDVTGEEEKITITIDGDKDITAHFVEEAYFEVEVTTPEEQFEKGEVVFEYTVRNTGGVEDTRTVEFTIDGVVEAGEEVTLGPDEEHDGEFTWEAEEIGEFEVMIRSADYSEEMTIQIVEEEVPADPETDYGGLYAAVGFIVIGILVLLVLVMRDKKRGGKDIPVLEKKGDESED